MLVVLLSSSHTSKKSVDLRKYHLKSTFREKCRRENEQNGNETSEDDRHIGNERRNVRTSNETRKHRKSHIPEVKW